MAQAQLLLLPSRLWQLLILVGCLALAYALHKFLAPRMRAWRTIT